MNNRQGWAEERYEELSDAVERREYLLARNYRVLEIFECPEPVSFVVMFYLERQQVETSSLAG